MSGELNTKVFTVTGGASGMGSAVCRLLAKQGAAGIAVADWNSEGFDQLKASINEINSNTKVVTTKVDVSKSDQVEAWIQDTVKTFGRLDGSANVAGVPQAVGVRKQPAILEETDETWRRTMGVNIDGVFFSTRAQIRAMVALPSGVPRSIVNVGSLAAVIHGGDCYAYGISKNAVTHFTACVAKDAFPFGIRVNAVSPGATATPMAAQFFPGQDLAAAAAAMNLHIMTAEDIARPIVWLLSENAANINGIDMHVGEGAP